MNSIIRPQGSGRWSILGFAVLVVACGGGGGLSAQGSGGSVAKGGGAGGQGGGSSSGGAVASGGTVATGGTVGSGGMQSQGGSGSAGSKTGGKGGFNAGGTVSGGKGGFNAGGTVSGGKGGFNAGGTVSGGVSGAGGTVCEPVPCIAIGCPYGTVPNPDPCGCPICAPRPDAGTVKDAGTPDGTRPDAIICPPMGCPAVDCAPGSLVGTDACGCQTCILPDAGADTAASACADLDECACREVNGCAVIAEACYCPFPACGSSGACICGGGRFIGCAPLQLATCSAAHDRVAALCPQVSGPLFDQLCQQSDTACVTKCLNEVSSCSDLSCSLCEDCDCASKRFATCRESCRLPQRG